MSSSEPTGRFAAATTPVQASTLIHTDSEGLVEGLVSLPAADGTSLPAYRAAPAGALKPPVILVIQEVFGVHEHIKDVARRFAKLGYFAVAPELFFRQGDVAKLAGIEEIRHVVARVPDAQALSDLDATWAWARGQGADGERLFATGFCWGGRIAWLYAAHQPALRAVGAWYGRLVGEPSALQPRHPLDVAGELKAPVLGLYGGEDQGIPLEHVHDVNRRLEALASRSTIHVYPTAPHAFHADYRPSYRKDAAEDAFSRLTRWFADHG